MDPQDDPEARIRALEPTELGSENGAHSPRLPPTTQQWPGQIGYGQPGYAESPYGADPYVTGYMSPYPWVPQQPGPAFRPWMVIVPIVVVVLTLAVAAVVSVLATDTSTPGRPGISGGGDVLTDDPAAPVLPSLPTVAQAPSDSAAEPGSTVTISGIGANRSITCNDNVVIISGANNTVDITGHCTAVTVSGFDNSITVESTRDIAVSGFDNSVTYRAGTPQVSESGSGNSIHQG